MQCQPAMNLAMLQVYISGLAGRQVDGLAKVYAQCTQTISISSRTKRWSCKFYNAAMTSDPCPADFRTEALAPLDIHTIVWNIKTYIQLQTDDISYSMLHEKSGQCSHLTLAADAPPRPFGKKPPPTLPAPRVRMSVICTVHTSHE